MADFDYISIDFETATGKRNSACSIGIVAIKEGKIVDYYESLIRPPKNKYSEINMDIHGITPDMTEDACSLIDLWPEFSYFFDSSVPVIAHNAEFDISVLFESGVGLELPNFIYADTMGVASLLGCHNRKLLSCAESIGISTKDFEHHNAQSDAAICALFMAKALNLLNCSSVFELLLRYPNIKHGVWSDLFEDCSFDEENIDCSCVISPSISSSLNHVTHKFSTTKPQDVKPTVETIPVCPLCGKIVVFTGEMELTRDEAMQFAVNHGAIVKGSVVKKTDYLVKGVPLDGFPEISSKERKALELIEKGSSIKIITETEFLELAKAGE